MRIAIAAALGVLAQMDPAQDDAAKRGERLERAFLWLENDDPEVREMGRKDIVAIGKDAVPAIEKRLQDKGVWDLVGILRRIDQAFMEPWVAEQDLQELKTDEKDPARYIHVKYGEALAHARRKNYQRGFDMANAILILEPKCADADAVKRLRRHCQTMITQTTLIEAKLFQPKIWYASDEPVELSARMKNIYKNAFTLSFDKGHGGLLLLEIEGKILEMGGASVSEMGHQEVRFEEEIPIAPGGQWEKKFTVDFPDAIKDQEQIRVLTVNGWTHPLKIDTDGINVTRRIQFEPAIVRIIPKKYANFLENPLEWLGKSMDTGTAHEVFLCSQILEGEQKAQGGEMLVRWMAKAERPEGRVAAAQILTAMTGQQLGTNPKRWLDWLETRGKK